MADPPLTGCRSCGAAIVWATTEAGSKIPLDAEPVVQPAIGLVVYNPKSGAARVLARYDLPAVERWVTHGATLHRSHWASCPSAQQHRVSDDQIALPL